MDDFGESIGSLVVVGLVIWGGFSVWNWAFGDSSSDYQSSYSSGSNSVFNSDKNCSEPENPYDEGSGHYAGWQWGEEGNYCDGNSDSFIEGCEEYESAEAAYEDCLQ